MGLSQSLAKDSNLNSFFEVIQAPIYNSVSKKNLSNTEMINCINLNMTNFKKYFPVISKILRNNEYYKNDLFFDFMEVRGMSVYILDNLENIANNVFLEITPYLGDIYDALLFVDIILNDFHQLLQSKNEYINGKLTEKEFKLLYDRYQIKLEKDNEVFYDNFYKNDNEKNKRLVKDLMKMEIVDNEFK